MPVDYSKWDALELSDDSDIEVHPNVDKRSFIRAKQNQIHVQREQRKHQIATLRYERQINDGMARRLGALIAAFRSHADEARTGNAADVAFRAVMESAAGVDQKEDRPPPRPEGVHANVKEGDGEEGGQGPPSYTRMMAVLLDQVNQTMEERKVPPEKRYEAMLEEMEVHAKKIEELQRGLLKQLGEWEQEESKKITSESIHTGFDSSYVNKPKPGDTAKPGGGSGGGGSTVELLNPSYQGTAESGPAKSGPTTTDDDDDDDIEASPAAKEFSKIPQDNPQRSLGFLSAHPEILSEKDHDGLLLLAFTAQEAGREDEARRCVHQALLIQYCRALGRDGVALFFKRITTPGHQARDVFYKDVSETYAKIRERTKAMVAERDKAGASDEGVEQIQLHAVEPGTVINISIPPEGAEDDEGKRARAIFEGFRPDVKTALETGSLDEVNKVLGTMPVAEAEALVGEFSEAGILSMEEQIIDATTEEGRAQLKQLEEHAAPTTDEATYDDPE